MTGSKKTNDIYSTNDLGLKLWQNARADYRQRRRREKRAIIARIRGTGK